jgi:hypothetical protein
MRRCSSSWPFPSLCSIASRSPTLGGRPIRRPEGDEDAALPPMIRRLIKRWLGSWRVEDEISLSGLEYDEKTGKMKLKR